MEIVFRSEKESALLYKELDDNFIHLNDLVSTFYRISPLDVTPCSTFNWNLLLSLNPSNPPQTTYSYWIKQACTSSFPWWTGSNGRGILASETYNTLDPGVGYLGSVTFGQWNILGAPNTLAHGVSSSAAGFGSYAEGFGTIASGSYSHAEGFYTIASGSYSHAEGSGSITIGTGSHAEGEKTIALGNYSHAEGVNTLASGNYSHAEGYQTTSSGLYSHAEGYQTKAIGLASHAEGLFTTASHSYSHVDGYMTSTGLNYQVVTGRLNILNNTDDFFVIGDGNAISLTRSNAFGVNATRTYLSNSIYFPNLTNTAQSFVLTYNTSSKQVFFTSSNTTGAPPSNLSIRYLNNQLTPSATSINFTGNGVVTTAIGGAVTVNVSRALILPISSSRNGGVGLTNTPSQITFKGSKVSATSVGNNVTVNIDSALIIKDEGNLVTNSSTLNFTGSRVSASYDPIYIGGTVNVNIPSLIIRDEGNIVTDSPKTLNFTGSYVSASLKANGVVDVNISIPPHVTTPVGNGLVLFNGGNGVFGADRPYYVGNWFAPVGLQQIGSLRTQLREAMGPNDPLVNQDYIILVDAASAGHPTPFEIYFPGSFTPDHGSILKFIIINDGVNTSVQFRNMTLYKGTAGYTDPIFTNKYETITIIYNQSPALGRNWYILKAYNSSL